MHLLGLPIPEGLRDASLVVLIVFVAALLILSVAFGVYALVLRRRHDRRRLLWLRLEELWQPRVLAALADPEAFEDVHAVVEERYHLFFVNFCFEMSRLLRGEELDTLAALAAPYLSPLRERARDGEVEIRTRAVQTLGVLGLPEYADVLIEALDDPSPLVSMVAARGLAREDLPEFAEDVILHLFRFESWNRAFLASMLASIGPAATEPLRRAFADPQQPPGVRAVVGEALHNLKDSESGDVAAGILGEADDPELLSAALALLCRIGRPEHVMAVRPLATFPNPRVRSYAYEALGVLGSEEDVPTLLEGLNDPSPWVSRRAGIGLRAGSGKKALQDVARSDHFRSGLASQLLSEGGE